MIDFLLHLVLTAVLLLVVEKVVKGFEVRSFGAALLGALVLGIINAIVRPVLVFLTFPITLLTLGLFLLVINALMLWLMSAVVAGVKIHGFWPALLGSVLLSILNVLIAWLTGV